MHYPYIWLSVWVEERWLMDNRSSTVVNESIVVVGGGVVISFVGKPHYLNWDEMDSRMCKTCNGNVCFWIFVSIIHINSRRGEYGKHLFMFRHRLLKLHLKSRYNLIWNCFEKFFLNFKYFPSHGLLALLFLCLWVNNVLLSEKEKLRIILLSSWWIEDGLCDVRGNFFDKPNRKIIFSHAKTMRCMMMINDSNLT